MDTRGLLFNAASVEQANDLIHTLITRHVYVRIRYLVLQTRGLGEDTTG